MADNNTEFSNLGFKHVILPRLLNISALLLLAFIGWNMWVHLIPLPLLLVIYSLSLSGKYALTKELDYKDTTIYNFKVTLKIFAISITVILILIVVILFLQGRSLDI